MQRLYTFPLDMIGMMHTDYRDAGAVILKQHCNFLNPPPEDGERNGRITTSPTDLNSFALERISA